MDKHTERRFEAQKRARNATVENRGPVDATAGGKKALTALDSTVTGIEGLKTEHSVRLNEMRQAYRLCGELRRTLYDLLKHIVMLSASVHLEKGTAEFMTLPRTHNDTKFIDDARAVREGLAANRQGFLDAGLPARVLDDLPGMIDDFAAAKDRARAARDRIGLLRREVHDRLGAGDKAMQAIEAILATSTGADSTAVRQFRSVKRVGPRHGEPAAPETPPTPAPTAHTTDPTAQTA